MLACKVLLEMASKVPGVQCRFCGEAGHRLSNCWKELGIPPNGFFSGGGAHRDHGDGEDEKVHTQVEWKRNEIQTPASVSRNTNCHYYPHVLCIAC